jgi:hypothetical protein
MRHQWPIEKQPETSSGGREFAELRHVLALAQEIAGRSSSSGDALDELARMSSDYERASAIVQRHFDALAAETAAWAAVGIKALMASGSSHRSRAAAARLADELGRAVKRLGKIVSF